MKKVLVTGGAGFIGSELIRFLIQSIGAEVFNVDSLTYSGQLSSLQSVEKSTSYTHEKVDIRDSKALEKVFTCFQPEVVIHLAAESHVDRSIDGPENFISTNIVGTYRLLHVAQMYWNQLNDNLKPVFRFHHVSTDEVFGSLGAEGYFSETSPYDPRSPYSASKACSDHLVRAWHHTYGLPTLITNCSNNYGPYQFPEKLIPLTILNALERKEIPVYGTGENVRDWLFVEDHARAIWEAATKGTPGSTYLVGGNEERTNIEVVETICEILDEVCPHNDGSFKKLIHFVEDRPGHDQRYAIDASRIRRELNWEALNSFDSGIRKTVLWYLSNEWWWKPIRSLEYSGKRLGLKT